MILGFANHQYTEVLFDCNWPDYIFLSVGF